MERILGKDQLYHDKIYTINAIKIDFGNGNIGTYERVESSFDSGGGVIIVPVDKKQRVYLIEQYQVGAEKRLLVLPRGGLEIGGDLDKQVNEELKEEIGYRANKIERLIDIDIFPGWYKGVSTLYLAQDLVEDKQAGDELEDLILHKVEYAKIYDMIKAGDITDSRTIAGLLYAKTRLDVK